MSSPSKSDFDDFGHIERNVKVKMNETGVSREIISSNAFGPCVGYLLDFLCKGQSMCMLMHYSFDYDETDVSVHRILESVINRLCYQLIRKLRLQTISN